MFGSRSKWARQNKLFVRSLCFVSYIHCWKVTTVTPCYLLILEGINVCKDKLTIKTKSLELQLVNINVLYVGVCMHVCFRSIVHRCETLKRTCPILYGIPLNWGTQPIIGLYRSKGDIIRWYCNHCLRNGGKMPSSWLCNLCRHFFACLFVCYCCWSCPPWLTCYVDLCSTNWQSHKTKTFVFSMIMFKFRLSSKWAMSSNLSVS